MHAVINVSKEYMRESRHFCTCIQEFFVLNSQSKKSNYFKNTMSPDPFVSLAKVLPDKSSNKNKNGVRANCALVAPTH